MLEIAHAQKRKPLSDMDEILQDGRYPRRNQVDRSVKGFGVARGQILAFPIDLDRRPYNTLAVPCECVIRLSYQLYQFFDAIEHWTLRPSFIYITILFDTYFKCFA